MWFIILIIFLSLFYIFQKKKFTYWKRQGVPGPEPYFLVGNLGKVLMGKESIGDVYLNLYEKYQDAAFVGVYKLCTPALVIRDLDFIKAITVKDFKHFLDNDFHVNKYVDAVFGRNPFFLKGEEWKLKRSQLITCFTPVKMKAMFPLLETITHRMVNFLDKEAKKSSFFNARDISIRLTSENVAACAFGVDANCFGEGYSPFLDLAEKFMPLCKTTSFKLFMITLFPKLASFLKIGVATAAFEQQLLRIVHSTLEQRRANNIVRNDFLEYIVELGKKSKLFLDDKDLVAQASSFYIDGYETSSRAMTYMLFCLGQYPDEQEKLRREINTICEKYGGNITYEGLHEMNYLDACFNESMRLYPALPLLMKTCTERYTYTPTNPDYKNGPVTIEPGSFVIFSLMALHRDPKYFDEPDRFMPERFMEGNIAKYAFIPIGEGPRACLGIRFGAIQIKLAMAQLVRNFRISVNKKTPLPFEYEPWYFLLAAKGGIFVDLERI